MIDILNQVADRWYTVPGPGVPIAQGDQFWGVVVLNPTVTTSGEAIVTPVEMDLVVLAQSCDLQYEKIESVLCAPMHPLGEWIEHNPADLARLEDIRQGFDASLYLLPAWPASPFFPGRSDRIVDFGVLRTVDLRALDAARQNGAVRLGLQSPAREHLAYAVARTFMRVGLPLDIPSFELTKAGREEALFTATPPIAALLHTAGLVLTQDIPIVISRRIRKSTGETYYFVITRSSGREPPIEGAGMDVPQAMTSFTRQLILRWEALQEDNDPSSWLRDFLAPMTS